MIRLIALVVSEKNWIEARWVNTGDGLSPEIAEYCQSYHPTQIDMLRAKAAQYSTPLDDYEQMLAEWVASYAPDSPAPQPTLLRQCTPAQGLIALYAVKGITEDDVLAAIASIPDNVQRYTAKIAYERAIAWQEDSPTMQLMQAMLSLTDSDMDALFDYAQTVNA